MTIRDYSGRPAEPQGADLFGLEGTGHDINIVNGWIMADDRGRARVWVFMLGDEVQDPHPSCGWCILAPITLELHRCVDQPMWCQFKLPKRRCMRIVMVGKVDPEEYQDQEGRHATLTGIQQYPRSDMIEVEDRHGH